MKKPFRDKENNRVIIIYLFDITYYERNDRKENKKGEREEVSRTDLSRTFQPLTGQAGLDLTVTRYIYLSLVGVDDEEEQL